MGGSPPIPTPLKVMSVSRKLRIFRLDDGKRVPYILELDKDRTVIAEYIDNSGIDRSEAALRSGESSQNPARRIAAIMSKWCAKSIVENPIPGTDDIRSDFLDAHDRLVAEHAGSKKGCPACKLGGLQRKFRNLLESGGYLDSYK